MSGNKLPVLSMQAVQRMPAYLSYLMTLRDSGVSTVTAAKVAEAFQLSEIQARKDMSAVCIGSGKPRTGFRTDELICGIEDFLGVRNTKDAVIVGAGRLGSTLMDYGGFEAFGLNIVAAFDSDPALVGIRIHDKPILPSDKISNTCRRLRIRIGIITVPASQGQVVCDQLVAGDVKAIWNFTSARLFVPDDVLVQNENLAASLAVLSKHLEARLDQNNSLK